MATYNGFKYPEKPDHLPALDLVSERFISPRIPFMNIRRLRHVNGQYGIYGQIINVPVTVDTIVKHLPRHLDDDHCINVHLKCRVSHRSSYLFGLINKRTIKAWLQYLIPTPLYTFYGIQVDESFFNNHTIAGEYRQEDVSEEIAIEESLLAQQQTLLWNEDQYLRLAPGQAELPKSLLFDEHAEELSFPAIYLGHFRTFREGVKAKPFAIASSELRRADRRGVTPQHLLYMAMKIMRLRVRDSLTIAFKHVGKDSNITRKQIEDEKYLNDCMETNLAFLRSIPNSAWYWAHRKKDLFAMIRQLGKPTIFLTVSANEIGWTNLLQTIYKLKNNLASIPEEFIEQLHWNEKASLINEDSVTCAVYFAKLVQTLLSFLTSPKYSPFSRHYVVHYFKRIEFQHRGSPHAHMLLLLKDAPSSIIGEDKSKAIRLIDDIISVSANESSNHKKLQTHKHTFTCYKNVIGNRQDCRVEAPFMPCRSTTILRPMQKEEVGFASYAKHYKNIRINLENNDYPDIDTFYRQNNISSDNDYYKILRAGIKRPRVFLKRQPSEKWHNPFNPFVFNIMKSNMDIQFISDEYSCANYVSEYVNKSNRGISNLQRQIIQTMDEHPEFDIVEIMRKLGVGMLNSVEMPSQEAAWYLLREPMSKTSTVVVSIPTLWPSERQRIRKTNKELEAMQIDDDSTDIWKKNWYDKYEKRHKDLDDINLAQFIANYTSRPDGTYTKRKEPRIIRYRNYDIGQDVNEYKREMVTLYIPFRNEDEEVLAESKFVQLYDQNEDLILHRRKKFESNLDIQKIIEICRNLCREDEIDDEETHEVGNPFQEPNPFEVLYNDPGADMNSDLRLAVLDKLGPIAKKRENLMEREQYYELMRQTNKKQRGLLLDVIDRLLSPNREPFQIFFTGPAGCGKTFVIKLLMEIYNRFTINDGHCNAYITCASTGKAAVAINGTTVHTAFKISITRLTALSFEVACQYRALFKYVKVIIIDEISMISAELLARINDRLQQITGNFDKSFGGLDVIFIGDLRQLPPVRATAIYLPIKRSMFAPLLWRGLQFYELDQVMRQANVVFASILTKLGNGDQLTDDELVIIQSRFFTKAQANAQCPNGIRLFHTNHSVEEYNNRLLNSAEDKTVSTAKDVFVGCASKEQENLLRPKLHKMSIIDTGGLPYQTIFVKNMYYMITTNIDVADGLSNGSVGKPVHIELNETGEVKVLWLEFPQCSDVGKKIRRKVAGHVAANNISTSAVPIARRSATIYLNPSRTICVKRSHLPVVCSSAITIHKSQGSTYTEVVYEYDKKHHQSLLYVALSRVTDLQGLFIVSVNDDLVFHHGRKKSDSTKRLRDEFDRLSRNRLVTIDNRLSKFIDNNKGISIYSFNCQSLRAHAADIVDCVLEKSNIFMFCETWLHENEHIDIPKFKCIVKYKRPNVQAGAVATYHNRSDTVNIVTPSLEMTVQQSQLYSSTVTPIGEFWIAECKTADSRTIVMIALYISPNQKMADIVKFIHKSFLAYSHEGAALYGDEEDKFPMILSGDFNVNMASDDLMPLKKLLRDKFSLNMNNDPNISTTRSGTTIDAVFTRYLDNVKSHNYVSHFSYHKPILSVIPTEELE